MGQAFFKRNTTRINPLSTEAEFLKEAAKFEEVTEDFIIAYDNLINLPIQYFLLVNKKFVNIGRFRGVSARVVVKKGGLITVETLMFDNKYITNPSEVKDDNQKIYKLKVGEPVVGQIYI